MRNQSILPQLRRTLSLLFLALLLIPTAFAAGDRGIFWQAEKEGVTIYLLGSVHLATPDYYPLRERIEQAYRDSQALVVEADVLAAEKDMALQEKIMRASFYPGQRTLRDELSAEVYARLREWLQRRQIPEAMFVRQRPAIAMISLSMLELRAQGLDPGLGIDRHFLKQAHRSGKPVLELEGVLAQLSMLNSLDDPNLLLDQTLEQLAEIDSFVTRMTATWKSGDMEGLYELVLGESLREHPEYAALYRVIFFDRNRNMAAKIARLDDRYKHLFVIVGAGHLTGDKSVISELEKRGFALKQL
ncbi:TraB/GumN family protein [Microbulbifer yueqingensis]|uniref:TraB family protein n=1 Tax=Microbulbifer yueqingensis TaxID=658219 RepID=A0A1G8UIJ9_9GAMM|nr:TraB/GumN family protein [Microbulbifer yueqingensis]SDJ53598.1 hypothetical protein SAMN05216212_0145 [Microbulbifer yueqingensis]